MKIIKEGKVQKKYVCINCKCHFEIDVSDIKRKKDKFGEWSVVECPTCKKHTQIKFNKEDN